MPARVAVEAAKEVSRAVSNDIAVFRTRFDVETGKGKKKRLVPVEAELHVNPVSVLLAAAAGLAGALFATIAWNGVTVPNPLGPPVVVVPGIKDTVLGSDLNEWYHLQRQLRRAKAAGGTVVIADPGADPSVVVEDPECTLLNREWAKALRRGDTFNADRFLARAKARGCLWADRVSG